MKSFPAPGRAARSTEEPARTPGRRRSIDLLRGIAVVAMIATHATDAFLAGEFKDGEIWHKLNIVFGFVAPAFIAAAGVTLRASLERRTAESGYHRKTMSVPLRRAAVLLLIGYWLQIPVLSLRQLVWNARPDELRRLFDVNVLQVIAVTTIAVILLTFLLRGLHRTGWVALILGIAVVAVTPYVVVPPLLPLTPYIAPQPEASFSLLPFSAYFLFGFAAAPVVTGAEGKWKGITTLLCIGLLMITVGISGGFLFAPFPPHADLWSAGGSQVIFRLGGVTVAAAVCLASARSRFRSGPLETIGRMSLGVYLLHLMLIYGSPMNMGMRYWFDGAMNGTLGPVSVIALILSITTLSYLAVGYWKHLRRHAPRLARGLAWGWWILFLAFFLIRP